MQGWRPWGCAPPNPTSVTHTLAVSHPRSTGSVVLCELPWGETEREQAFRVMCTRHPVGRPTVTQATPLSCVSSGRESGSSSVSDSLWGGRGVGQAPLLESVWAPGTVTASPKHGQVGT